MAQLGQNPHGFKDLDFLMVLKKAAVPAIPIRAAAGCPLGRKRLPVWRLFSRKPPARPSERSDYFGGASVSCPAPDTPQVSHPMQPQGPSVALGSPFSVSLP